jgi:threonine dehydrogenase-like Zn-dependent dehydrogenase
VTVKALVYHGEKELKWEEAPDPEIGEHQLLIEPRAVGVCGSDLHGYLGLTGRRIPPMIMGHEFSGVVRQMGRKVEGFAAGDRVCVQPIQFCGTCDFCRQGFQNICPNKKLLGVMDVNGAMAELVAVNADHAFALADGVSFIDGSMVEPFSVANSATKQAPELRGKNVAVVGAGTIGLCLLQFLVMGKPRRIIVTDLSENRLSTAEKLGAHTLVNPGQVDPVEAVLDATDGLGADIVFEAVGESPTARQSVDLAKIRGNIVWIGNSAKMVEIDMQKVVTTELNIQGSYGFTTETFEETLGLMNAGKLRAERIISVQQPLSDGAAVFEKMLREKDRHIKAILVNG